MHGAYRVAVEGSVFAFLETAIGFFPDVGASHVLPRMPGSAGTYIGLTGARLSAPDAAWCGLATHVCRPSGLAGLRADLVQASDSPVAEVLDAHCTPLPQDAEGWRELSPLAAAADAIDTCFSHSTLSDIRRAVSERDGEWARSTSAQLAAACPSSLHITLWLLQHGVDRSLEQALRDELRLAVAVTASADFLEGVRAVLVDKDQQPRWSRRPDSELGVDELRSWFDAVVLEA